MVCACIGIFGHWRSSCLIFAIFFSFLSDVLSSGIWPEAASLTDSSLIDMIPGLIDLQLGAKAPSTGVEVQVWLVAVAQVGFVEDWCFHSSRKTFSYCIVYF